MMINYKGKEIIMLISENLSRVLMQYKREYGLSLPKSLDCQSHQQSTTATVPETPGQTLWSPCPPRWISP